MVTSERGRTFIEQHEGLKLKAYQDGGGVWTIGYGHTGPEVVKGLTWTQEQADAALASDLAAIEKVVNQNVTYAMNQNQFDALVSLAYNIGPNNFRHSTLVSLLNQGAVVGAAAQFLRWDHIGVNADRGLLRRRIDERDLFLEAA